MALSLRGTAENSAIDGLNVTVTHPGGIAENDVVFLAYSIGSSGDAAMSTVTAGYTELCDLNAADLNDGNLGVYWKVMPATPDSTVECQGLGSSTRSAAAVEHVWTGVDTGTPIDATTTTATAPNSAIPDSPSITTVTNDAIVLSIGASGISDTAVTAPTGYSNQVDINAVDSNSTTCAMASKLVATGGSAENPAAWTNWTDSADVGWCAATVAIRPASTAAPPITLGGIHHIGHGMGDPGVAVVPQTLHTIDKGIAA